MKLTVIVPVFNAEDTIEACIRSLLHQKNAVYNEDYAILVVDDGSTDRTAHLLSQFQVPVIRLPKNEGRIVARLTGARNAGTDKLLFVDARVTIPEDVISRLDHFRPYPAVIGEIDTSGAKYETVLSTVLYLVRRRYYGKEYFPLKADELLITRENFKRAPKGTAVLLIDRELFIRLTPERTGKDANDDTLLFHNLVFEQDLPLLRSRKLLFHYSQRTDLKQFTCWLFHRGVRFSDFYLRPGGYFYGIFLSILALLLGVLAGATIFSTLNPWSLFHILAFFIILDCVSSAYLSESWKDLPRVFLGLPAVTAIFGAGVAKFWLSALANALKAGKKLPA